MLNEKIHSYKSNLSKVGIGISLLALLPWPTDFYLITRLGISLTAGLLAYALYKSKPEDQEGWWVLLGACTILYNPIFPVYLNSRPTWMFLNILTALLFWKCGKLLKEEKQFEKNEWDSPWK